jgi:SAM-dependent methyltransferase
MISFQKIYKGFYKSSTLQKLFYFLSAIIIINIITNIGIHPLEGFEERTKQFISKQGNDIYDDFYVQIYDDLVFSKLKNDFEIGEIINKTSPTSESYILDIGSGTGHHVSSLDAHGYKAIGIDNSNAMIKKAKNTYPELKFKEADAINAMTFNPNSFTHITCLYFTIYYIKEKRLFFSNCMKWLLPGGYLALHLVDRKKFDPVMPAGSPFSLISPQNYTDKRITSTVIQFDQFEYKANFDLKKNENIAVLNETFKNKNGGVRKNEHKFYMETQKEILGLAKETGFILHAKIDMLSCQYENQYIYILKKTN